jgi:hypothetical protein
LRNGKIISPEKSSHLKIGSLGKAASGLDARDDARALLAGGELPVRKPSSPVYRSANVPTNTPGCLDDKF